MKRLGPRAMAVKILMKEGCQPKTAVMGRAADKGAATQGIVGMTPVISRLFAIRTTIKAMKLPIDGTYPLAVNQRLRKA